VPFAWRTGVESALALPLRGAAGSASGAGRQLVVRGSFVADFDGGSRCGAGLGHPTSGVPTVRWKS